MFWSIMKFQQILIMSEQFSETVYDLTQLRGHADDNTRLWQLVQLLTQQNKLHVDSLNHLQQQNQSLRQGMNNLAVVLKVNPGANDAPKQAKDVIEGVHAAVRDLANAAAKVRQVQVPIFVEREVLVQRRVEVPVEIQRVVQVEVQRVVEVEVPVEVERIIEKVVQVIVEKRVEVPVFVEKLVERIVEVERVVEVPVERVVQVQRVIEVKVEVEKPIYIERLVEVQRPIMVERIIQVPCQKCLKK